MSDLVLMINELIEVVKALTQLALEMGTLVAVVLMVIHSIKHK